MDNENIQGSWDEQKRKLKARFINLTNSDLSYETGKSDEMFNQLQIKLGISREKMAAILSAL